VAASKKCHAAPTSLIKQGGNHDPQDIVVARRHAGGLLRELSSDIHRVVTTLDANNKSTMLFDSRVTLDVGKSGNAGATLWATDSSPPRFSFTDDGAKKRLDLIRRTTARLS
jgi:hypothetical protein